jgi:excinuclease ABC subunit A
LGKYRKALIFWEIEAVLIKHEADIHTPINELGDEALDEIINGSPDRLRIPAAVAKTSDDYYVEFN